MCSEPIFFVDTDLISRLLNGAILRENGFEVREATSGAGAMAVLDSEARLGALVTSIDLGAGPDGFEVASFARALRPGLPVVYLAANELQRSRCEGEPDGVFVAKPCDPDQLVKALDRLAKLEPAQTGAARPTAA